MDKSLLKKNFSKKWKETYAIDFFKEKGFERKKCILCGSYFWTLDSSKNICQDSDCVGYNFIGEKLSNVKLDYVSAWKLFARFFKKRGHSVVKRFPTVARWRKDIYFTLASITGFQPYVVSGEVSPIANPLVINQPCIRFNDIENVGITGRHYSSFVMIGQHAFNNSETGLFYWKNEAIEHDFLFLNKILGIDKEEIVFKEDVWIGGGNAGPSLEYFVRGLELGNCVFMQYAIKGDSLKELDTKVIDMGAGQERFAWITNTLPMSYDISFGSVANRFLKEEAIEKPDYLEKFVKSSAKYDLSEKKSSLKNIAKEISVPYEELVKDILPMKAAYSVLDHLRTLLFTTVDGMLPSNSGGGYNLRYLVRRVFSFYEKYSITTDYHKLIDEIAYFLKPLYPELYEDRDILHKVIDAEYKKYRRNKEKTESFVNKYLEKKKAKNLPLEEKDLAMLYESYGIVPEQVIKKAEDINLEIKDRYFTIQNKEIKEKESYDELLDKVSSLKETKKLYYDYFYMQDFDAEVIASFDDFVVLDKTAFYPRGGGQEHDTGYINEIPVIEVIKKGNVILHRVEKNIFKAGNKVHCRINFERRYQLAQHHTATHLLNAVCKEVLGKHIWQASAHKKEDIAYLDITHYEHLDEETLEIIELKVNEYIEKNLPVVKKVMDRAVAEKKYGFHIYQGGVVPGKKLRIVNILGVDVEACGGTHLDSLGQIGYFKIVKRESVKDGVERIYFKAGMSAVRYALDMEHKLKEASNLLGIDSDKFIASLEKIYSELKAFRRNKDKFISLEIERILKELDSKDIACSNLDKSAFMKLCVAVSKRFSESKYKAVLADNIACVLGKDAEKVLKEKNLYDKAKKAKGFFILFNANKEMFL